MKCPFSGKPCLIPKEIFVTEVKLDGIQNIFLCKMCGEQYIDKLADADVVTKSLEVISSSHGVSYSEKVMEDKKKTEPQPPKEIPESAAMMRQILQIEGKLDEAIKREDYESAAKLRDILGDLKTKIDERNNEDDSTPPELGESST